MTWWICRKLDNTRLLASREVSDNILGLLGRSAGTEALRSVLERIAGMEPGQRVRYLQLLFVIAGLRGWEEDLEREAETVPVIIDVMANKVLGRERRVGLKRGLERGLEQGLAKGRLDEGVTLLRRMLEKKFGPLPSWADQQLSKATLPEIEDLAVRLVDSTSLKDLFRP